MKYTISNRNRSDGLTELNPNIIDNNRPFIITSILPYCSNCGGTGRCGGSCIG